MPLPISNQVRDDISEAKIPYSVPSRLVYSPFHNALSRIYILDSDHIFDEKGNRAKRGPTAEVRLYDLGAIVSGHGLHRTVSLPKSVRGIVAIGEIHVPQELLGGLVGHTSPFQNQRLRL